ncbi:hypothetical protein SAMN05216319_3930 [Duganella sp. CF402]|uniref:hypothetical protein n=1 Tax=unclassified Duganella TaxID=2636909 RepID=UPI0008D478FE|nr:MULTISPECIES: hypothetical protein [unclassified Duganella]RZT04289.1 hypothetical protein EV582_5175 [Duganella sp. BK701]SEM41398.1 hypothetical protein SAMN05216319_3930 [Duganella sp. CF402]
MRCVRIIAATSLAFSALQTFAQELTPPAHFHGTGRACQGELVIQRQTILWRTPFSVCKAASYRLLDQTKNAALARYTYRLDETTSACRYRLISLTHDSSKPASIGWEVTGYGNAESYERDKAAGFHSDDNPDMMSCYLIQTSAQHPSPMR